MRSMPPLALYYLATILEDNGIEVDIVDPSIILGHNILIRM